VPRNFSAGRAVKARFSLSLLHLVFRDTFHLHARSRDLRSCKREELGSRRSCKYPFHGSILLMYLPRGDKRRRTCARSRATFTRFSINDTTWRSDVSAVCAIHPPPGRKEREREREKERDRVFAEIFSCFFMFS